jgi:Tfp pilus assembly PilM family ATPase
MHGEARTTGQRLKDLWAQSLAFTKTTTCVGVDIGREDIKLVKVSRSSDRRIEINDYARTALDPKISRDHPDFYQFLHSTLVRFCGLTTGLELWATIPSAQVETRYLKIPKVPEKQIANTVYWSYQKVSPFDEKNTVFDFYVLGDAEEGGVKKIAVMAYIAPRKEVEDLQYLFGRAGFALSGISIIPFAIQTLLRSNRVQAGEGAVASLYVGRDWSRIDIFSDNNLLLSRGIKAGVRTMLEALGREIEQNWFELSLAKSPTSDQNRIRAIKARLKQELEAAQNLFFAPIYAAENGSGTEDKQPVIKDERIFQMLLPALERRVRKIERTFRHFSLNFDNIRVEKIFVSSSTEPHARILDYIGDELDLPVELFQPFAAADDFRSVPTPPESIFEQSSYAPALGMALASNSITPNFLYTHKNKVKDTSARRLNQGVFTFFFLLILACVGFTFWQENLINEKDSQRIHLQSQLGGFEVRVDKNLILRLVDQIRARNQNLQGIGNSVIGVAVVGEVANATPANIRLLNISARFGAGGKAGSAGKPESPKKILVIEGVVFGDRATLESDLAAYLMTLKNSPLFKQPTISKKSLDVMDNQPIIRFTAQMDVV